MADRMRPMGPPPGPPPGGPGGGMPPSGGMPSGMPPGGMPGGDPLKDNESFMNPADLAMKQKRGMDPNITLEQFLVQEGFDLQGPAGEQLTKFALKQKQNSTMRGKAQNIAPASAPAGPPAGAGEQPGMAGILQGVT